MRFYNELITDKNIDVDKSISSRRVIELISNRKESQHR